jgi:hypothetical protein
MIAGGMAGTLTECECNICIISTLRYVTRTFVASYKYYA